MDTTEVLLHTKGNLFLSIILLQCWNLKEERGLWVKVNKVVL